MSKRGGARNQPIGADVCYQRLRDLDDSAVMRSISSSSAASSISLQSFYYYLFTVLKVPSLLANDQLVFMVMADGLFCQ